MCSGELPFYPRRRRTSEPLLYPLVTEAKAVIDG